MIEDILLQNGEITKEQFDMASAQRAIHGGSIVKYLLQNEALDIYTLLDYIIREIEKQG